MGELRVVRPAAERPQNPSQLVAAALAPEVEPAMVIGAVAAMSQHIRKATETAPRRRVQLPSPQLRAIEHVLRGVKHRNAQLIVAEQPIEALDEARARPRHVMRLGME